MAMEMGTAVAVGAAGGILADKLGEHVPDPTGEPNHLERSLAALHEIARLVQHLHEHVARLDRPPLDVTTPLSTVRPYRITTFGRKHSAIWSAKSTNVTVHMTGVGDAAMTLAIGWNAVDLPDDTEVLLASGSGADVQVLVRYSDDFIGQS